MINLLRVQEDFFSLHGYRVIIKTKKFGFEYEINFDKKQFPHLVGLQHYKPINALAKYADENEVGWTAKRINNLIKKELITYKDLENTGYWHDHAEKLLKERVDSFSSQRLLSLLENEIIIHFDKKNVDYVTNLDVNLIFFDRIDKKYYHLGVKHNLKSNSYNPATFFITNSNSIIKDQLISQVDAVKVIDLKNNVIIKEIIISNAEAAKYNRPMTSFVANIERQ